MEINEQNLRDLKETVKCTNIQHMHNGTLRSLRERNRKLFEDTMAENFQNWMENINLHIQEFNKLQVRYIQKRPHPDTLKSNWGKPKKERILKSAREK